MVLVSTQDVFRRRQCGDRPRDALIRAGGSSPLAKITALPWLGGTGDIVLVP